MCMCVCVCLILYCRGNDIGLDFQELWHTELEKNKVRRMVGVILPALLE